MTITLGGLDISDNMYLSGLESAQLVSVEQLWTIDGNSVVRSKPLNGGRRLTLGSQNQSGVTQGIWCLEDIQQVQVLEQLAQSLVLSYRGTDYNVIITGTTFNPLHQFEVEGPYKKFIGSISLTEV